MRYSRITGNPRLRFAVHFVSRTYSSLPQPLHARATIYLLVVVPVAEAVVALAVALALAVGWSGWVGGWVGCFYLPALKNTMMYSILCYFFVDVHT